MTFWKKLRREYWFDQSGQTEERIKHLRGSKEDALSGEDEEVLEEMLEKVLKAALLFEPTKRATAKEIVQMVPEMWEK
ncbi:hypothetical protein BDD12DRAFT_906586 [Trichophaea hybrida]|nr:hypothetical protein BDD12DRAFT_906586 [Trichophaea hybrida]